ncbi:peptidase S8/S53 domain-containing protein [Rhodofomes roseus]|uniref:Peptidase S8/S53 domain-containing protein n=1 Tax=Rhodofomes roseus TaxID=34475 RepID=A0ABQ8K8L2_9APHY|nr:peptidase S8/S53 domain-containing protein [Rhodofomes roseus]KAH9833533.1 peptidase S8/S53 domain-containing protein [Rhodofomes roseus]
MSFLLNTLLAVSLAASGFASPLSTNPHEIPRGNAFSYAPLVAEHHPHGSVNSSYIVMFKDDIAPVLMANHMNFLQGVQEEHPLSGDLDAGLQHVYDGHVKGYAGKFSDDTVHRIRQMPEVDYIERDQIVRTLEVEIDGTSIETQKGAPWGLARISHRPKLTFGTFTKYEYDPHGGEGVDVYVIDTGINVEHAEFEGRASWGKTVPQNDEDVDANGHGTHCAGTIASRKYGVAKAAHVVAVKVLGSNGSGTMSDVMAGVVWTVEQALAKAKAAAEEFRKTGKTAHKGSVANMSLGGGKSKALDDAVNRAVDRGVHFAVAAGNDNKDACNNSPAAAAKAVTVGASTLADERAYFSNHGPCVDIFAPGLNVLSTYIGSKTAVASLSGTSMASPHTAGILAYLLSLYGSKTFNPDVEPDFSVLFKQHSARSFGSAYVFAHSVLPSWVVAFLPPPELVLDVAPVPPSPPTITPTQLKIALFALATEDALDTLPSGTPNLLIFNNATA